MADRYARAFVASGLTPGNRIAWLDTTADAEKNLETMREHAFSRYPVYRGNDQDIAGILDTSPAAVTLPHPLGL